MHLLFILFCVFDCKYKREMSKVIGLCGAMNIKLKRNVRGETKSKSVRFHVHVASMKMTVFWAVAPCSLLFIY
jgi:hypothetical protein